MPKEPEFLFYSRVDDELYDELAQLAGERIVHAAVWEDSMVDALAAQGAAGAAAGAAGAPAFDMDIYLEGGVYFELYSVTAYNDPESDPIDARDAIEARLNGLLRQQTLALAEVAVDEDDGLVLVLGTPQTPALYLAVGGWVLEEWDELPV